MYHKSVDQFMEALASKSPVPGGGGAAALGGSMAAALGSMVCEPDHRKESIRTGGKSGRGNGKAIVCPSLGIFGFD